MSDRSWIVTGASTAAVSSTSVLRDALLDARSIAGDTKHFFEPRYIRDMHDPMLMFGMDQAVKRVFEARKKGQRVMVYGDYDADGITSTAIVVTVLRQLGVDVWPWLPHRIDHGYGLNRDLLEDLSDTFDLLISVDCGISNVDEVAWLSGQGKDVIIVDHHDVPDVLPSAHTILHPRHPAGQYPFPYLCGAGVSWKLATALLRDERSSSTLDQDAEKWLLDLVCLGTVADMVSMTGENRAIVRFGLQVLRRSSRPGVRALISILRDREEISEETLGFRLIPLLNAAGRIDHPQPALDLLLATTERSANDLLRRLVSLNNKRRTWSKRVQAEAEAVMDERLPIVFAANTLWPAGVVGLVAGRLSEKYQRPAFVIGGGRNVAVGSARAPDGINLIEVLAKGKEFLTAYGGHMRAAGFTVLDGALDSFRDTMVASSHNSVGDGDLHYEADMVVSQDLLSWDVLEMLESFAPFGEGNRRPYFICRGMEIAAWRPVGKTEAHAKLTFRVGEEAVDGIGFNLTEDIRAISSKSSMRVDVLFQLEVNDFKGRRSLQLNIKDVASAGNVVIAAKAEA